MQRTGVSAVTAYTAHREWATRPPDERFASVSALNEAARVRRARTEERTIETHQVRTAAATDDDLVVQEASGHTAPLTHWSFEQLAAIAGAPPKYLRTLPAPIASSAINVGLERQRREGHQLFADREVPWTVHAITSSRYTRVHHDELAARVLDLMADHSAWHLPLGYKDGVYGAELVPSGAYLGDRDMFLLLVDGNCDLEDPTDASHGGLFRGFILRNSDVGAAALTLDVFLYRRCAATTSSGAFSTWPAFDAGTWVGRSTRRGRIRWSPYARRSTRTSPTIGRCSDGRQPWSWGPRARRCSMRSRCDWSCRASRPPTPTGSRSSSRRIPAPSGATCKD
jgi:hypothetical protein